MPLVEAMTAAGLPGTVTAEALLGRLGLPAGPVRLSLLPAGRETADGLREVYERLVAAWLSVRRRQASRAAGTSRRAALGHR